MRIKCVKVNICMHGNTLRLPIQTYNFNCSWLDVAYTMQHLCSNSKDFTRKISNNLNIRM